MSRAFKIKGALLAAASLTAATLATAHASDAPVRQPAPIELAANAAAADEARATVHPAAKIAGVAALATAGLALLARLLGRERVEALARAAAPAVRAIAAAPSAAVRAIGRAATGPVRFAVTFAALAAFGFTGLALFEVEWIGGAVVGGALVALVWSVGAALRPTARARSAR